jgi:hypothetical protein
MISASSLGVDCMGHPCIPTKLKLWLLWLFFLKRRNDRFSWGANLARGVVASCDVTHALTNNPVIFFIKKFGWLQWQAFFPFFPHVGFTLHGTTIFYVSISGNTYCLVIVDDYSRFTCVFFLYYKSDVFEKFKSFAISFEQNQFENDIKKVRGDKGLGFKNARPDDYCDDKCIQHYIFFLSNIHQNKMVLFKGRIWH